MTWAACALAASALLLALGGRCAGAAAVEGAAGTQDDGLASLMEMIEMDYEDQCREKAEADWSELMNEKGALQRKLEQDKAVSNLIREQMHDLKVTSAVNTLSPLLSRRLDLLLSPGDALLDFGQWSRLVSFGDEAVHALETAADYDCGDGASGTGVCTLAELRRRLASEQGEGVRRRMKESWERRLPDENVYLTQVLPLLNNASKLNGYDSVEAYWEALAEYEGALAKAQELWKQVQPLYDNLHKYVAMKLTAAGVSINTDTSIPVHALGSLLGDDWSNIAEDVLPKHADIYDLIKKNLNKNHLGGREAFLKASELIRELNLDDVDEQFWSSSAFDKSCPTRLVHFCVRGSVRAFTCSDVSLNNYLDAHEALMKVKYQEYSAAYSNNSHVLREANRYSAVYEGIAGLAPLLALTPLQLQRARLVPLKYFERNRDHNQLVLQLLLALRDLPRLNYYLVADAWRLKTLKKVPAPIPLGSSWSDYRRTHSLVAPGDKDFLGDPQILFNSPYLGSFMGIILKYQIYESFTEDNYDTEEGIVAHVANNHHRILEPMTRAFSVKWPDLVSDIIVKRGYGVDSSGITNYFSDLNRFLEKELDPNNVEFYDQFDQPEPSDLFETTSEKEVDSLDNNFIDQNEPLEVEKEDIQLEREVPSEKVLENKHLIEKENLDLAEETLAPQQTSSADSEIKEAGAYQLYLWIGIGVVVAVLLILILVIAKKRYSHRKELERERKEGSRA